MAESKIFLVRIAVFHQPRDPDSKGFIARVFVEFPKAMAGGDADVQETIFEAARAAAVKGYILKGQKADFELTSIEAAPRVFGKPIEKPLMLEGGIRSSLMGEER